MVSVTDSMQVTKETLCICEQCVPGAPSDFSRNEAGIASAVIILAWLTLKDEEEVRR